MPSLRELHKPHRLTRDGSSSSRAGVRVNPPEVPAFAVKAQGAPAATSYVSFGPTTSNPNFFESAIAASGS